MGSPLTINPFLKVERANEHVAELIRLTEPLHRSFYTLYIEANALNPNAQFPSSGLCYRPNFAVSKKLALIIGDAIHNFRAALDHLATGIIRTKFPDRKPYFPANLKWDNLVTSGDLAAIEASLPGAKDLMLQRIRPENDARDHLWAFSSLDIHDKHNLILPTVSVSELVGMNIRIGTNIIQNLSIRFNADGRQKLIAGPQGEMPFDENHQLAVEVKFGQGFPFENDPVVPTLTQIGQLVTETINAFDILLVKSGM